MIKDQESAASAFHHHVYLGEQHASSERKTWAVIWLCTAMMVAEIAGGWMFGSIALIADGLHMSTHAGALLLAALAYTYARKYARDPRFTFGTGKLGDLAGFTSAIILAMISLLVGYEAVTRLFAPVPIHFGEAIPIACLGLAVNVVSAWLLSHGGHDHAGHSHGHGHHHAHDHAGHDHEDHAHEAHVHAESRRVPYPGGQALIEIHEEGVPPRFRFKMETGAPLPGQTVSVETVRSGGARRVYTFTERDGYLESIDEIPEPHAFEARVWIGEWSFPLQFEEHGHGPVTVQSAANRDNNMRAAVVHVIADAAVSVLVILGLLLARTFGWLWMDPLAGLIGAAVIASWAYGLVRDTAAILLDMNPDGKMADTLKQVVEGDGDEVADLHLWRLGPGHIGAILLVITNKAREASFYRGRLAHFKSLSHLTVEVVHKS